MPKISKARIVNFMYNDGNRLIADELFDFSNEKDDDALNVLINLENGGGKSVLVQLLMQPVNPRAKVGSRKIESYFHKLSDHGFVVLEWIKDNSSEKLLTGIAMAAREIASTDEEMSGGMGMKYYTFYANYTSDDSVCSLVNLPLSSMENRKFIPAEYDVIKKLSRKYRGQITYYASDDNPQWQRKLAEYGLYHDEWKMIEKLNSVEGGLPNFFDEYKTSDQLIDGLLIPAIERKIKLSGGQEDSSLVTMLLSYARQYVGQKHRIREKQEYEAFQQSLEALQPVAEALGNRFYAQEERTKQLFGLSAAMKLEAISLQDRRTTVEQTIARLEKQIQTIRWEEKSQEYYHCQDELTRAEALWNDRKAETDRLEQELAQVSRELLIQECANYHQQLQQHESSMEQLRQNIEQKQQGLDTSEEINVLGYSAACAIEEDLGRVQPELQQNREHEGELNAQIIEKEHSEKQLRQQVSETQSACDRLQGSYASAKRETDQEIEALQADFTRRLDGFYGTDDLDDLERELQERQKAQSDDLAKTEEQSEQLNARLEAIPQALADCGSSIREVQRQTEALRGELEQYDRQEEQVRAICEEHNLDFSKRFSSGISEFLQGEQQNHIVRYGNILRKISLSDEEIDAAKSGFLHVPRGVIEYLNSTGVIYSTCEKYLLDLVQTGKLTNKACLELLRNYPAAAYGVLMSEDQIRKFFSFEREQWLPAMIPIFTPRQMEQILRNEKTFSGSIAFYSEAYFADREHYITHLTEKQQELLQQKVLEEHRKTHIQNQLDGMKEFTYSAEWKQEQLQKIAGAEEQLRQLEAQRRTIEAEQKTLQQERKRLSKTIESIREAIRATTDRLACLGRARVRLDAEYKIWAEINVQTAALSDRKEELGRIEQLLQELQQERQRIQDRIQEQEQKENQLKQAYPEVREKRASRRLPGTWEALLQRYRVCVQNENAELSGLQKQLESEQKQASNCQKELQKRALSEADYLDVIYSELRETDLRQNKQKLEAAMPAQRKESEQAAVAKGQAEGRLQSVRKELDAFGAPLEKSRIGTDFASRIRSCQDKQGEQREKDRQYMARERTLDREYDKLKNYLSGYPVPEQIPSVALEKEYAQQCKDELAAHTQGETELRKAEREIRDQLKRMLNKAADGLPVIPAAIRAMSELMSDELQGDRYFTLSVQIDSQLKNTALAISQITTDLKEFENSRSDLVRQCALQGRQIYDGLRQMEASSRVTVCDGKPKQRMIQFDFPERLDPAISEAAIAEEIDQGTRELAEKMTTDADADAECRRCAERIVGSRNLLRKYLGKEFIQVKAYKIDQNPENSGYRKWKDTQINNSGAEKFIVYFAVILSLINYTRGSVGGIQDKELRSVLMLDNPFGTTSSRHILMPMFAIAKHFRVQMICLSHINKTDVMNCFDIVIQAIIKKRALQNQEILTHEGNEQMEHGYYRSEQMSLL